MISKVPAVRGVNLDAHTRCQHYHGPTDIIAIKMKCCGVYYACKECHESLANHPIEVWPELQWDEKAVLCGVCGVELTVRQYMQSSYRCLQCKAQFNPRCQLHHHHYFESQTKLDSES